MDKKVLLAFTIPREGEARLVDGHYISLGRDARGRLLALITKGHPNAGDKDITVCSAHVAKDRKEAGEWFAKNLISKPWVPRQ